MRVASFFGFAILLLGHWSHAGGNFQVLYGTSFEDPPFTANVSPVGVDGWLASSGGGARFIVVDTLARTGDQSLRSQNLTSDSFASIRRNLGGWDGSTPLLVRAYIWIDPATQPNRLFGVYLGAEETSTLGGSVLGLSISGDGSVRAGISWNATYTNDGLQGQAKIFASQWLEVDLSYDPATGVKGASITGTFGTIGNTFLGGEAPGNLNLGTDWFAETNRAGTAFFDDVFIVTESDDLIFADNFEGN